MFKDRFKQLLEDKKLTPYRISKDIKVSQGTLKNYLDGATTPTASIMKQLSDYLEVDEVWLLTGEGPILKEESATPTVSGPGDGGGPTPFTVPLLPVSAKGGRLDEFTISVKRMDCEKVISPIEGAQFAITISGDSMAPEYPNGSRVLIKKVDEKAFLEWGRDYALDTCNGVVIKRIMPASSEDKVKCISLNEAPEYAPFEVYYRDVFGFYRVMLCMSEK